MTRMDIAPVAMGIMMGAMALWMLHGFLTGEGSAAAGILFVAAHVGVVAFVAFAVWLGLHRKWPALSRLSAHRPSLRHFAVMMAVAFATAGVFHLLHGGPTWT